MYELDLLAAPLVYGPCRWCGHSRFYERATDAFVCFGCGGREELGALKRPAEPLRIIERLRRVEPARDFGLGRKRRGPIQTQAGV